MKIFSLLGKAIMPLLLVSGFFLQKVYDLLFILLSRIPFFGKLEKRGQGSPLYWINVAATVILMLVLFSSVALGVTFIAFSKDLPSPDHLTDRKVSLSTKIYDRNGVLLYDIYGDENRTLVTLDKIPLVVREATIATEDKGFYSNPGFDILGIARAAFSTIFKGRLEGGSTITQQVVKNTLLSPERTILRKIREFILAVEIDNRYSKDEILQMYFNETPYGGQAIGIQAAAESYFGKNASELNLAEAALLAGLPAAPSRYSPFRDPELAKWRQGEVLQLMREDGYITEKQEEEAKNTKLTFKPEGSQIRAPHFVMYVRELLAERYGENLVESGGLRVTTTLDISLQDKYQQIVADEVAKDRWARVSNGALLAMDPKTGEILSMVGSKDYFATDIDGQFNVTTSPSRQPGSSIKPLMYVTAFKQGYSPATTLIDEPTTFQMPPGQPPYRPQDFANHYNGILSVRTALGNSKNIPAVKMLSQIGVHSLLDTAHDMGITTLTDPNRYGISLTLGGGEVKMLDMVTAFSVFATEGIRHDPIAILKVTDPNGQVLEEFHPNDGVRVLTEQQAYLMDNILSDSNSRTLTFGGGNQLGLHIPGHTVAVKTGTTDDNRDNWAFGFTPAHPDSPAAITIGTWIGNDDNSPMNPNFFAGAARIWNQAMVNFLQGKPDVAFVRPKGIVDGCVDNLSGMAPGPFTGDNKRCDIFIDGTVPTQQDDWREELEICTPDGKLASDACKRVGKTEKRQFIKIKAEKPEWQGDVDAWVAQAYADQAQYFPPTEVSSLCFDSAGNTVDCTATGTGPLLDASKDIAFYNYNSGALISKDSLPAEFEVRATPTPQSGTNIAFVRFWLDGPDCANYTDRCNKDAQGNVEGQTTSATCGNYCYSSKQNIETTTASGTSPLPLFRMDSNAPTHPCVPGPYTLSVVAQDTKGGVTPVVTIPITLVCN